jgi:hypothetical protein
MQKNKKRTNNIKSELKTFTIFDGIDIIEEGFYFQGGYISKLIVLLKNGQH